MENRYGVDVDYFRKELLYLVDSLGDRPHEELERYLRTLADVAADGRKQSETDLGCRIKSQPGSRINGVEDAKPMGGDLADALEDLVDVILVRYSLRQEDPTTMDVVLSVNERIKEHKLIVSNELMKLIRGLH